MVQRPAPTRWETCGLCGNVGSPETMQHISAAIPARKRGWAHDDCIEKRNALTMIGVKL
jgi:hypothetical protein